MPDLITHVAASHLLYRFAEIIKQRKISVSLISLFVLGTILPDILTRPLYIIFPVTHDWTIAFHTPMGMLLTTGFIAMWFKQQRKSIFITLFSGAMCHFILDACQKKVADNDFWFFPFSWKSYHWGIFWADDVILYIPFWIAIIMVFEMGRYLHNRISLKKRHEIL